jgi:hypothetical protein
MNDPEPGSCATLTRCAVWPKHHQHLAARTRYAVWPEQGMTLRRCPVRQDPPAAPPGAHYAPGGLCRICTRLRAHPQQGVWVNVGWGNSNFRWCDHLLASPSVVRAGSLW